MHSGQQQWGAAAASSSVVDSNDFSNESIFEGNSCAGSLRTWRQRLLNSVRMPVGEWGGSSRRERLEHTLAADMRLLRWTFCGAAEILDLSDLSEQISRHAGH
jgi:hypothetical protein